VDLARHVTLLLQVEGLKSKQKISHGLLKSHLVRL
jgi:hypothetical protein